MTLERQMGIVIGVKGFLLIPLPPLTLQSSVSHTCCANFQPPQPPPWPFETAHFQHFLNEFTLPATIQKFSSHQALILTVSFYSFFTCIKFKLFPFCFKYQYSHIRAQTYVYIYIHITILNWVFNSKSWKTGMACCGGEEWQSLGP